MQAEWGGEGRLSLNGLLVWILMIALEMTDCKLLLTCAVLISAAKWEIKITACSSVCGGLWVMMTSGRTHTIYTSLCIPYEDKTETDDKNALTTLFPNSMPVIWKPMNQSSRKVCLISSKDVCFLWMSMNHQKHWKNAERNGSHFWWWWWTQHCASRKSEH